jgi:exopolysaccharide production protein ExoQ
MANDDQAYPAAGTDKATPVDMALFLAFLLLVFVGLKPFAVPSPEVGAYGAQGMTGSGDALRQAAYLLVFAAVAIAALRIKGAGALFDMPATLLLLLAWCLLSTLWAAEPGVALRRAGLAAIVAFSAVMSERAVGPARAMRIWRAVLLAVLLANIASIHFIPQAVHQPGEADPALVGNWRGLYGHKNIAGAVGAMTALLFVFAPRRDPFWLRKAFDIAIAALAVWFVFMTRSKSSLGLFFMALAFGLIYRLAWRREIDRLIAVVAALTVLAVGAAVLIADLSVIERFFSDPTEFTGRTEIWKAEIAYFFDHPALGAGFGSFADTGGVSPLRNYASAWVSGVSHGHNGYLQVLMTLGGVGFLIALVGLIVLPIVAFWRRDGEHDIKSALFALFAFLVLHNFMESDFLEGDGTAWVAFLLMLAMLYDPRRLPGPS